MSRCHRLPLVALLLAGLLAACDVSGGGTQARQSAATVTSTLTRDPTSGLPFIAVRDLPPEGQRTLHLIRAGGPFPYRKDGSVFGNREGVLPRRPAGSYREYTVPTPGEGDRGARRIVCLAVRPPTPPDAECYYSADHYTTFRRIRP
ncbi:guanine-specific ribonuclease N1 and T1 [Deinococcus geothermalis DSM 11300]|uniref:Guanine-specific ribonuclease N1 and T1 n=1 Tax=Deinococcus geothermalis (strain DSM 11300 / CIP 105573 / AG-3a) TaxID=319795 RepID=Q1IZI0_DEIGD|nr:ribonuclease domain-containing protein [Deinococcus geothermalis]ABF45354.1 guanine-specific ribonuclease N1 and T1 [Deinococcus geothermalis DSM 11300]